MPTRRRGASAPTARCRGSADNAKRFHNPDMAHAAGAEAYVTREWQEDKVKQRYEWLFTYDATTVPCAASFRHLTSAAECLLLNDSRNAVAQRIRNAVSQPSAHPVSQRD